MISNPAKEGEGPDQPASLGTLLSGDPEAVDRDLCRPAWGTLGRHAAVIVVGAGAFGAAIGLWRDPKQALFTAIKLPLILLLCAFGNALLNGMIGALLGLKLTFRQSFLAILMSFSIAGTILGSISPLLFFYVWNMTPFDPALRTTEGYSGLMVLAVAAIAFAGIASNVRLLGWLDRANASRALSFRILFFWLAGNLLLGSQLSWILRPFFGSPGLEIQFLRPDAFHGNFFQALWIAVRNVLGL